ncbi:MAG TPA: septal ring lytic transglycosylase RlpA family protein [Rhodopila sp.]|nr:septal ring lytic transglycosylase RlpA family protein [Rhodopila sp.]
MKKCFAAAFVAASALASLAPHPAHARPSQTAPSDNTPPADPQSVPPIETGDASFYGPSYHGRRAANGRRFNQWELTAAHAWLPFGTRVRVTLAGTGRSVIVTITDRFYSSRRVLDLSFAAARSLGILRRGVAQVQLTPV